METKNKTGSVLSDSEFWKSVNDEIRNIRKFVKEDTAYRELLCKDNKEFVLQLLKNEVDDLRKREKAEELWSFGQIRIRREENGSFKQITTCPMCSQETEMAIDEVDVDLKEESKVYDGVMCDKCKKIYQISLKDFFKAFIEHEDSWR